MRKTILLLLLYIGVLSSVFAIESIQVDRSADNEGKNKNYFRAKFSYSDFRYHIFNEDIYIKIHGIINRDDSLHFQSIIDTIQELIKPKEIKLVKSNSNLNFYINHPNYKGSEYSVNQRIYGRKRFIKDVVFNFLDIVDQEQRNKMITYYLVRSIVDTERIRFPLNSNTSIDKSIFSEKTPLRSKFLEIDKLMVKWLYSGNPEKYLIDSYGSYREYMRNHHPSVFMGIVNVISFIIAFLFLLLFVYSEVLNLNAEKYFSFVASGSLLVICYIIFDNVKLYLLAHNYSPNYEAMALLLVAGVALLTLVYFVEKLILQISESLYFKLMLQFFSIVFIGSGGATILMLASGRESDWYGLVNFSILLSAIAFARVIYNYQRYKTKQLIMQKDVDLSRLSELKSKAELNALHSRINPHFLYNSLNSIATLAKIDAVKTEKMALALSDFCRSAINRNNETYASVTDEVEIVKSYLEIEKIRFGSRLDYSIEIADGIENIQIPRFIIQPLIENAIKHGISKVTDTGMVKLCISKIEDKMQIKVFDNGPDFPEHLLTGHGLQSIHDKLDILYKDLALMNWENGEHKSICITLPIRN